MYLNLYFNGACDRSYGPYEAILMDEEGRVTCLSKETDKAVYPVTKVNKGWHHTESGETYSSIAINTRPASR